MSGAPVTRVEFCADRFAEFLDVLEQMAAGDMRLRLKLSDRHDELDALAHGVNVLVGELSRSADVEKCSAPPHECLNVGLPASE